MIAWASFKYSSLTGNYGFWLSLRIKDRLWYELFDQLQLAKENEMLAEIAGKTAEENKVMKELIIKLLKENQKLKTEN